MSVGTAILPCIGPTGRPALVAATLLSPIAPTGGKLFLVGTQFIVYIMPEGMTTLLARQANVHIKMCTYQVRANGADARTNVIGFITMINRKSFPASLFGIVFMAALLLVAPQSHAAMQTFEKEYTYTASELDSKSSCRAIALEQVKRILLQELGVYVESVFNDKASSDGRTKDEVRREITTLSAGVASTEVVEEKWDGTTYWLKARIKADPDDVAKKIEALRQDKQKVAELEESRKRAEELSQELERMHKELDATKSALSKAEQARQYNDTAQHLSAEDWFKKAFVFISTGQNAKAVEAFSKAIELNPEVAEYFLERGRAYILIGEAQRAIEDLSEGIKLSPKDFRIYWARAIVYREMFGNRQQAMEDFKSGARLGDQDAQDLLKSKGIPW